MPLPAVWGPVLWKLLHAMGYKGGDCIAKLQPDEDREFRWLLMNVETIVPCPECREHIVQYRKANPLPSSTKEFGFWIWNFHTSVSIRLEKPPGPAWNSQIGSENSKEILKLWKVYQQTIQESIFKGSVKGDALRTWTRRLALWNSYS